jgi:hypothetical protein
MQPFRSLATASAEFVERLRTAIEVHLESNEHEDRSLDVLVRHAIQADEKPEADVRGVWKRLSGRVEGPFGGLAIEGPAGGAGTTVMATTGISPFPDSHVQTNGRTELPISLHSGTFRSLADSSTVLR